MLETFQPGTQNRRLLERLLRGPVFNHEIRDLGILNHSGRISDVRRVARDHGLDVTAERITRGAWMYRIEPLPEPDRPRGLWEKIKGFLGGMK